MKYTVSIREIFCQDFEIEAEGPHEARVKVDALFNSGDYDAIDKQRVLLPYYVETLPRITWEVS